MMLSAIAATGTMVLAQNDEDQDGNKDRGGGNKDPRPFLTALDEFIQNAMKVTGVPGVAAAVVYKDEVIYRRGFGVCRARSTPLVDADTVFQIASVSKPIASTVVASLVSTGNVTWNESIADLDPKFKLSSRRDRAHRGRRFTHSVHLNH